MTESYWPACLRNQQEESSYPPGPYLESVSRRGSSAVARVHDELGITNEYLSPENIANVAQRLGIPYNMNAPDISLEHDMRLFFPVWFADQPEKLYAMDTFQATERKMWCMLRDLNNKFIQYYRQEQGLNNEAQERHMWRLKYGHRKMIDRYNTQTEWAGKDMPGEYTSPIYEVPINLNPDLGLKRGWNDRSDLDK